MKRDTGISVGVAILAIPAGKVCKLCGHKRPFSEFVWTEHNTGVQGVSERCYGCRHRGKRRKPGTPQLRFACTRHAVDRYIERVRPELAELPNGDGHKQARMEMRELMAYAPWDHHWPWWVHNGNHGSRDNPPGFLIINRDLLFVLARRSGRSVDERVIVTVLTRVGSTSGVD